MYTFIVEDIRNITDDTIARLYCLKKRLMGLFEYVSYNIQIKVRMKNKK